MKKKAVIVSGYFNPIHKGHLEYFNNAKAIADELFVIVNNDHWRFQIEEVLPTFNSKGGILKKGNIDYWSSELTMLLKC